MGLLVILGAIVWPAFDQMLRAARLTDGASELRTFLREARRHAIEDAVAYRCDFLRGSSQVRMIPADHPLGEEEPPSDSVAETTGEEIDFVAYRKSIELPEGVRILTPEEFDAGPPDETTSEETAPPSENCQLQDEAEPEWIPLAELYPDGSASPAVIRLVDDRKIVIELTLDALTGQVTIGEEAEWLSDDERLERAEQSEQPEAVQ